MTDEQQPGATGGTPEPETTRPESGASPEQPDFERPEIWIGSLADYNNGDLHGDWLDAAREAEDIHADIQDILASGAAARRGEAPEEWGIFDYQGFGALRIGEYESIEDVSHLARAIAEHGPAFAAWANGIDRGEATVEGFQEAYQGRFDSVVDYARQLADDLGYEQLLNEALPDHIRSYVQVNYEQLAHDLQVGGDISSEFSDDGGVYIFRNE